VVDLAATMRLLDWIPTVYGCRIAKHGRVSIVRIGQNIVLISRNPPPSGAYN